MRRLALLVLIATSVGCGQTLPEPVIHSIQPAELEEGQLPLLEVAFDATLPFSVDYAQGTARVEPELTLLIGESPVELQGPPVEGRLKGNAPFGLDPGTYDVTLVLADGRRGSLAGGLQVAPAENAVPRYPIVSCRISVP